jgi:hypothetical protein
LLGKKFKILRGHLGWDHWWWLKQNRKPKKWQIPVRRINIPESNVEGILQDKQGNIWIGGSVGKDIVQNQDNGYIMTALMVFSNSFKVGAAYQDAAGILYLGGIRVLLFSILKNPTKPTSANRSFTNLKIFNQTVQIGEEINNRVVLPAPFNQLDELEIHAKMKMTFQ